MAFPPFGNSDHVYVSVSIDFPSYSQQDARFHCIAFDWLLLADWDSLCDHLRGVPWDNIFKLSASAAAFEFCEWFQVGIDVYLPYRKCQVKPHSSPWFSAASAAAIVHRNHFFHFYQKKKSSESKVKFNNLPKLHMLIKQRVHHFPETWLSILLVNCEYCSQKGKSATPPLFNGPKVFSFASDKAKLFN